MTHALDLLTSALLGTASATPVVPDDADVNAGWLGFLFLLALTGAVVFLGFSLTKQLRRVRYASVPVDPETDGPVEYEEGEGPDAASGTPAPADAPAADAAAPAPGTADGEPDPQA